MGAYRVPSEVPLNSHLPDASRAVLPAYLLPVTGFIAGTKGSDDNPLHDLILRVNAGSLPPIPALNDGEMPPTTVQR